MPDSPLPEELSPAACAEALAAGTPVLIDCREPDEHAICRIHGAKLVPLGTWSEAFPDRFPKPDQPVIVYCHHGMRSLMAVRFLRQQGYPHAQSLAGGIAAWSRDIDPSVPRY